MMADERPGDLVQAMMDLGAMLCRPKKPRCGDCPLRSECAAYASGEPERFPKPRAKKARPHRHGVAYWIERGGQVWLVRRPAKGLLGGMAALPGSEWGEDLPAANALGTVRHVFTHFSLDLHVATCGDLIGEGWWHRLDRLDDAGLPTLYRKAAELALGHDDRLAA
jgi:A/G-specific adenine glycosylase